MLEKIAFIIGVTLFLLLFGCEKEQEQAPKDTPVEDQETTDETDKTDLNIPSSDLTDDEVNAYEKAKEVLLTNLQAATDKDLELYMSTLHVEEMDLVHTSTEELFSTYDLKYEIVGDIELTEISTDLSKLKLKVVQRTTAEDPDSDFINNELTATHTLELIEGVYKITETDVDDSTIKYLDKE